MNIEQYEEGLELDIKNGDEPETHRKHR